MDVHPQALAMDKSSNLYTLSVVEATRLRDGNVVGKEGGNDLLLSKWDAAMNMDRYRDFGSAFDDAVADVVTYDEQVFAMGTFWDEITVDNIDVSVAVGNRGAFLFRFSESLDAQGGISLSSTTRVRIGNLKKQSVGQLVLSGWYEDDLYLNDRLITDEGKGAFLLYLNENLDLAAYRLFPCTGMIRDIQTIERYDGLYHSILFSDTIRISDSVYASRSASVYNTTIISMAVNGMVEASKFIASSYDQTLFFDEKSADIQLQINFAGNLRVAGEFLRGRPIQTQTATLTFNENLVLQSANLWKSDDDEARLIAGNSDVMLGIGNYNHWIQGPTSPGWLCTDFANRLSPILPIHGGDILLTALLERDEKYFVFGLFDGMMHAGASSIETSAPGYTPFFMQLSRKELPYPIPSFISNPSSKEIFLVKPDEERNYFIYDITGRPVQSGKQLKTIDVRALIAGHYILMLDTPSGMVSSKWINY